MPRDKTSADSSSHNTRKRVRGAYDEPTTTSHLSSSSSSGTPAASSDESRALNEQLSFLTTLEQFLQRVSNIILPRPALSAAAASSSSSAVPETDLLTDFPLFAGDDLWDERLSLPPLDEQSNLELIESTLQEAASYAARLQNLRQFLRLNTQVTSLSSPAVLYVGSADAASLQPSSNMSAQDHIRILENRLEQYRLTAEEHYKTRTFHKNQIALLEAEVRRLSQTAAPQQGNHRLDSLQADFFYSMGAHDSLQKQNVELKEALTGTHHKLQEIDRKMKHFGEVFAVFAKLNADCQTLRVHVDAKQQQYNELNIRFIKKCNSINLIANKFFSTVAMLLHRLNMAFTDPRLKELQQQELCTQVIALANYILDKLRQINAIMQLKDLTEVPYIASNPIMASVLQPGNLQYAEYVAAENARLGAYNNELATTMRTLDEKVRSRNQAFASAVNEVRDIFKDAFSKINDMHATMALLLQVPEVAAIDAGAQGPLSNVLQMLASVCARMQGFVSTQNTSMTVDSTAGSAGAASSSSAAQVPVEQSTIERKTTRRPTLNRS